MEPTPVPYPASVTFDPPERVANWRPLVQWLLAIPHWIVLSVLQLVSGVLAFVSWFIILFTGRLPEGIANIQAMYLRYYVRTWVYSGFLKAEYPPFSFETSAPDPADDPRIRADFAPELQNRNRLTTAFRFILVIPQLIVLAVLGIAAFVVHVIAFFAVLFTGRWPEGLRNFSIGYVRWYTRVEAYGVLIVDEYPPFALN